MVTLGEIFRRYGPQYRAQFGAQLSAEQVQAMQAIEQCRTQVVGVLQTWTRDLRYHPHVHYLVPTVGLARDGQTWIVGKCSFLVPRSCRSRRELAAAPTAS
jgi:hypothetical protein